MYSLKTLRLNPIPKNQKFNYNPQNQNMYSLKILRLNPISKNLKSIHNPSNQNLYSLKTLRLTHKIFLFRQKSPNYK